jgi:hypothetical protein
VIESSRGLAEVFVDLRKAAAARGASHIHFSDYDDGGKPSEAAQFYACPSAGIVAAPSPAGAAASRARFAAAIVIEYVPAGFVHTNAGGVRQDLGTLETYGFSASLDRLISSYMTIGVAPGVILGLHGDGVRASATQLDMRLRARVGWFSSDGPSIHAYGTVGASLLFLPGDAEATGAVFGAGIGASYPAGSSGFLTFEAGYQYGMQTLSPDGAGSDPDASTRLFLLGVGLGRYF